ncbi:MAG: hypothetical protein WA755_20240 [Candidatus Acidiferrales bacterium]
MELQEKIVNTLRRFESIEYSTLRDEVLFGSYSSAAEREFAQALEKLRDSGRAFNHGFFNRWWLAPEKPAAKTDRAPGKTLFPRGRRS